MIYQQQLLPDLGSILKSLRNFCSNTLYGASCAYSREARQFLLIHLQDKTLAIPRDIIREIYVPLRIQPVPDTSPQIVGVINIRDEIVPVVNLFFYTGLGITEFPARPKLLITRNTPCTVAFAAGQLGKTIKVEQKDIKYVQPGTFISSFFRDSSENIPIPDIDLMLSGMK